MTAPEAGKGFTFESQGQRLLRTHSSSFFWLQILVDFLFSSAILFVLTYARFGEVHGEYRLVAVISFLLMWIFYNNAGIYRRHTDAFGDFTRLLRAWGAVCVSLVFIAFMAKSSALFSRPVITTWFILSFIYQYAMHRIIPKALEEFRSPGAGQELALLVGAGELGKYLAERINTNPWLPVKIAGVVDDNQEPRAAWDENDIPVLGRLGDIRAIIRERGISRVYISLPLSEASKIEDLYLTLLEENVDVNWAPDIFGMTLVNLNVKEIGGVPILALSETPLIGERAMLKSLMDKTLALLAIIFTSPIMIATAIAIKITSPGPVFYKQKRHGWNVEVFEIWKFRSMMVSGDGFETFTQATKNDPRVTKVGRFIRRTSIDELPQLFNVLTGSMSLVGPRPHPLGLDHRFSKVIAAYFTRHRIKPGMTGLAQVRGFRGETETLEKMKRRVECDLEYINNWSLMLDLKILIKTMFVLFSKKAY